MPLLLRTMHGSHLYGTAHDESDFDTFEVHSNEIGRVRARNAKQTINDKDDSLVTDLSTFMLYAEKGVPQYLEAMYSRQAEVDLIRDLRFNFYPNPYQVEKVYARTIRNFWNEGSFKRCRHAWRLWYNLLELRETGQFNPTLSRLEADQISFFAREGLPPPVSLEKSSLEHEVDIPFHMR